MYRSKTYQVPVAGVPALLDALSLPRCVASSSHPDRIRRSLELVGERWTMLILREAFTGRRRFDEMAEKILSGDEQLPTAWPVDGTTGYDFMTDVEDLFLDAAGYRGLIEG